MYGVTGRMGLNQHLVRSILAIREQGGVALPNGDRVMPDPILIGRNAEKIAALARQCGIERHTTDLDAALQNPGDEVFFDAATTQMRADLLSRAIEAGKHVYCEKPVADQLDKAVAVAKLAKAMKAKNGCSCRDCARSGCCATRVSLAACSRCAASSAIGCSRATGVSRRNGRAGTIARPKAAALFWICCATGA